MLMHNIRSIITFVAFTRENLAQSRSNLAHSTENSARSARVEKACVNQTYMPSLLAMFWQSQNIYKVKP